MKKLIRDKRFITIMSYILFLIIIGLIFYGINWYIQDFLNDYRCSNMPLNEFFQDKSCIKYWRLR